MSEEKKNEVLDQANALSDQEMKDVAAGAICLCAVGGGGPADQKGEETCACVLGGCGFNDENGMYDAGKDTRCICPAVGYGDDMAAEINRLQKCGCTICGTGS